MRDRLRARPQTPLALIELTRQRAIALPNRMLIDHATGVLHNPTQLLRVIY
jgi:hypothetical protein